MSASQHNGKIGTVVNFDALTARYHVMLGPGTTVALKDGNVTTIEGERLRQREPTEPVSSTVGSGAFQRVRELLSQAVELEGYDSDYTKVIRPLEASLGIELHNSDESVCQGGSYDPPAYCASFTSTL